MRGRLEFFWSFKSCLLSRSQLREGHLASPSPGLRKEQSRYRPGYKEWKARVVVHVQVCSLEFILRYTITQYLCILYDSKPRSGKVQRWVTWLSDIGAVGQLLGDSFGLRITAAASVTRCSGCILQNEKGDGRAVLCVFLCFRKRKFFTRSDPIPSSSNFHRLRSLGQPSS